MTPHLTIEKALQKYEQKNRHSAGQNFFSRYAVLHERLTTVEYAQAMQGFPGGNDHGPQHIYRVLEYLDALLGKHPLKLLSPYELFLAMMAVLYHDVGMLLGRDRHADKSAFLLSLEQNDYIFDDTDKEYIGVAVVNHSSSKRIEDVCLNYPDNFHVRGHQLRIRLVAALVRLADELDEDERRAPANLESKMEIPEDVRPSELGEKIQVLEATSKFFWAFNRRIKGVTPDHLRKHIAITLQLHPEDAKRFYTMPDGSTDLFIRQILNKILKINQERIYCNRFLPETARYSQFTITLMPSKGCSWKTDSYTITDTTSFDDVWPQLSVRIAAASTESPSAAYLESPRTTNGAPATSREATTSSSTANPFHPAGTLPAGHSTYVTRDCDKTLRERIGASPLISIMGATAHGKSSLALQFRQDVAATRRVCYLDFQETRCDNISEFNEYFFGELGDQLKAKVTNWNHLAPARISQHDKRPVVIIMDEFGLLNSNVAPGFVPQLVRFATTHSTDICAIVCIPTHDAAVTMRTFLQNCEVTNEKYLNVWYQIEVGRFQESEIRRLLSLLPQRAKSIADKEYIKIETMSEGSPKALQSLCSRLWDAERKGVPESELIDLLGQRDSYR